MHDVVGLGVCMRICICAGGWTWIVLHCEQQAIAYGTALVLSERTRRTYGTHAIVAEIHLQVSLFVCVAGLVQVKLPLC